MVQVRQMQPRIYRRGAALRVVVRVIVLRWSLWRAVIEHMVVLFGFILYVFSFFAALF